MFIAILCSQIYLVFDILSVCINLLTFIVMHVIVGRKENANRSILGTIE